MAHPTFDPRQPLPGAPDPWAPSEMPGWRDGPPYVMTEMIAAEPALAARVARRVAADPVLGRAADAIRTAAANGAPITITGCGTSHHAAIALALLLADGLDDAGWPDARVSAVQAFEASRRLPRGGVLVGVSHEGGTAATNDAVAAARAAGATAILVTVSDRSPGAALSDLVLATAEQDQSWCHTVGYLSPLVAGAVLHGAVRGSEIDPNACERQVALTADEENAEAVADALAATTRLLVVGSGADHGAARELALKVEEGVHLPATAHELETIRHGHLAAADERTGLVAVLTDAEGRGVPLVERTAAVLRSATALGMPAALIAATDRDVGAPAAARALVPLEPALPRAVACVLAAATPLQSLAERLARARGTNPDTLGRENPRQAAAASA